MKNKLVIEVTQEDIDQGTIGSCDNCPISLAAKRLPKVFTAETLKNVIRVYYKETVLASMLPGEACNFIRDYDASRAVKPFSFEVEGYECDPTEEGYQEH